MARPSRSSALSNKSGSASNSSGNPSSTTSLPFGDLSKLTLKPPSLPLESDPRHVALLNRSLCQSDKEIVALDKLHESIRTVKNLIVQHFGEEGLLNMVSPPEGGDPPTDESNKEYFNLLQGEFLSRMKLRRKLLNRLARRLLRTSHAMDGNILGGSTLPSVTNIPIKVAGLGIFPPAIPKYGLERNIPSEVWDLVTSNTNASPDAEKVVEEFMQHVKEKEEALQRIKQRRGHGLVNEPKNAVENESATHDTPKVSTTEETAVVSKRKKNRKETGDFDVETTSPGIRNALTPSGDIRNAIIAWDPLTLDPDHQADLDTIKEYDDEYAKVNTPTDGTSLTWAVTTEDLEEVHKTEDSFSTGVGIGATVRSMSTRDKLTEWKRWSTELLSRIPVQPTFEDLGMDNLIFGGLEERKKRARGSLDGIVENSDASNPKTRTRSKRKKSESDDMERRETRSGKKKTPDDNDDTNEQEEPQKKPLLVQKQKWFSLQPIPSFRDQDHSSFLMIQNELLNVSVQQQSRSRLDEYTNHHGRVYRRSVELNTQKSKLEADLRNMTYAKNLELNKVRSQHAGEISALRAQYSKEREAFEASKKDAIHAKLQSADAEAMDPLEKKALNMTDREIVGRSLQGAIDRVTIRMGQKELSQHSVKLQNAVGSVNPSTSAVGSTLSQMMDVVTQRVESSWVPSATLDKVQAEFNPPMYRLHPVEESIFKRYEKMESDLREQLAEVNRQLAASEAERAQAWAKLVKARGEMDVSNTASARKAVAVEPVKVTQAPHTFTLGNRLPASFVASSAPTVSVPSNLVRPEAPVEVPQPSQSSNPPSSIAVPLNVTNKTVSDEEAKQDSPHADSSEVGDYPGSPGGNVDGKSTFQRLYSVEAVKARMSIDGSIAPVTTPKKTKDGLFVRPAGRQRKNMDWDAVNGKWIPLQHGLASVYPGK